MFAITARLRSRRARMSERICRSTKCSPSRAPERPQAARRRCSRSATSRSCATAPPPTSSPGSAMRPPFPISPQAARAVLRANRFVAAPQSGPSDARRSGGLAQRYRYRRGSCSSPHRSGCATAADRTTARPTSIRRCGSRASAPRARQRVPFTSGILIGIGETREERIDSLLALRELHDVLRAHPGDHHPELPAEVRNPHGARRRRQSVEDSCGRSRLRDCCLHRR